MTAEDKLQTMCVDWFRANYPELSELLIAIPNGGSRNVIEAMKLKRMGVLAGVSDLILLTPRKGYGSLCLECKVRKGDIYRIANKNVMVKKDGKQSDLQHEWELQALSNGNKYVIFRSLEEFKAEIESYLK